MTNGASFKLFKAGSYSGLFASVTPATPGAGLAWVTNTLATGVISITNGVVTGITFGNASITATFGGFSGVENITVLP